MYPVEDISPQELMSSPKVKEIRESLLAGKPDKECARCIEKEQYGFESTRQHHIKFVEQFDTVHGFDNDAPIIPQCIEVRFTNVCNFKCRMCYPDLSSLISKEIADNPSVIDWYPPSDNRGVEESGRGTKFFDEMVANSKHLKRLYLTGGEPSVSKAVTDYMETLIELGYAKNINLSFSTNASVINPGFIELLSEFKSVQILLSLDAVGSIAEYQRHGTDWPRVAKNVQRYKDLTVSNKRKYSVAVHSVVTAYSILGIDDFFKYLDSTQLTGNMTICYNDFYKVQALIGKSRYHAIRSVNRAIDIASANKDLLFQVPILTSLVEFLEKAEHNQDDWDLFYKRTKILDEVRNENFEDVFRSFLE